MKVKKEILLLTAGIVWGLAGINILRIGIISCFSVFSNKKMPFPIIMMLLSVVILTGFLIMFRMVVNRNTKRILSYPAKKSIFSFLDKKGYLLMAFMMVLGITLRAANILPTTFFAVFYTGLGSALTLAGMLFAF